jgi:hypothetical protein
MPIFGNEAEPQLLFISHAKASCLIGYLQVELTRPAFLLDNSYCPIHCFKLTF